jgi:peptidoglycan/LPS O-acetylase OafA/YrhL
MPAENDHRDRPAPRQPAASPGQLTLPKYRDDIDGLRAIAVLAVIGFHTFPNWIRGGFVGVDVFFVISGYLISSIVFGSLDRGSFSFTEFYSRRIKRIFPALIVVLVASYAVGWFELSADEYKQLGKHIAGSAGFVQNYVLASESGYFDRAAETKPLLHLWSLGIEEQFYIIWPPLLFFTWKRRPVFFALIIAIVTVSLLLNAFPVRNDVGGDFFSPVTRSWELLLGGILAYLSLYKQDLLANGSGRRRLALGPVSFRTATARTRAILRDIASILGLGLLVAAVIALNGERFFHGGWALLPAVGTCMLIASGPQAWCNRVVLASPVLVWIGLISYPLYLWHWPLLSFARIIESATPSLAIRVTAVLLSIALAWLTYQLIERPIRFGKSSKGKVFVLCALMLVTGYVGYDAYRRDGLGNRFPESIQALSRFTYDVRGEYRMGTCLVTAEDKPTFGNCVDGSPTPSSPSIVLWGDSYAAHLYPGIKSELGREFRLTQLTLAACPPTVGVDIEGQPHCKAANSFILERVIKERPDRIILAANWRWYPDWRAVGETVRQLRTAGAKRIDVVGPFPQWNDGLRRSLFNFYRQDVILRRVPERMTFGLVPGMVALDREMQTFVAPLDVNYISPMQILCNQDGCLTRVGGSVDSLIAYDAGHLTSSGSAYLVAHFPQ